MLETQLYKVLIYKNMQWDLGESRTMKGEGHREIFYFIALSGTHRFVSPGSCLADVWCPPITVTNKEVPQNPTMFPRVVTPLLSVFTVEFLKHALS